MVVLPPKKGESIYEQIPLQSRVTAEMNNLVTPSVSRLLDEIERKSELKAKRKRTSTTDESIVGLGASKLARTVSGNSVASSLTFPGKRKRSESDFEMGVSQSTEASTKLYRGVDWRIGVPTKYTRKLGSSNNSRNRKNKDKFHADLIGSERWTSSEDAMILRAIEMFGPNWNLVASLISNSSGPNCNVKRTPFQILERYNIIKAKYKTSNNTPWMTDPGRVLSDVAPWSSIPFRLSDAVANVDFPRGNGMGINNRYYSGSTPGNRSSSSPNKTAYQYSFASARGVSVVNALKLEGINVPGATRSERDACLKRIKGILQVASARNNIRLPERDMSHRLNIHPSQTAVENRCESLSHVLPPIRIVEAIAKKQLMTLRSRQGQVVSQSPTATSDQRVVNTSNQRRPSPGQQGYGSSGSSPGRYTASEQHMMMRQQQQQGHYSQYPRGQPNSRK